MHAKTQILGAGGRWIVLLLSVVGLAASSADLRLVEAAKAQDKAALGALIKQNADVNAREGDGATALHWAAYWDDLETADLLIRAGARIDTQNDLGVTPLWLACANGSAPMVEKLLGAGANPNLALSTGETPLMAAARTGKLQPVKALIEGGADVKAKEPERDQTALMWAVAEKHADVARLLLEAGAELNGRSKTGFTPLLFAAREGDLGSAQLLVAAGANVNEAANDGNVPLVAATVRGHTKVASFLLDHGADPDVKGPGYTALHWAAGAWDGSLTGRFGLTSPNTEWSALGGLRGQEKLDFVKVLLAHGANPNARVTKAPPRFGFTQFNDSEIGNGGRRMLGATPLVLAAMAGDVPVMRVLLAAGADPQLTINDNTTLLMMASGITWIIGESRVTESEALEAVKLAVELGGDVNATNDTGDTALHASAYMGADSIVQFLVDKGTEVNVWNNDGVTPFMIANGTGPRMGGTNIHNPSTAELLRKLGADTR